MRPIIFIENHYATYLYYPIAVELKSRGYPVILLYWSAFFAKKWLGEFECIQLKPGFENEVDEKELILGDRAFKYFERDYKEYLLSDFSVECLLRKLNPRIIIGEPTLFYELQIALVAKRLGYVYTYIGPSRFFRDRVVAYDGIKLKHLKVLSNNVELQIREKSLILENSNRSEKVVKLIQLRDYLYSMFYSGKNIRPTLFKKISLEIKQKFLLKKISNHSINYHSKNKKFTILFPMQMQPESNSDVWGRPHSDQFEIIRQLGEIKNVEVIVKLNPTIKYEMTQELLDLIVISKSINIMSIETKMSEVINYCDAVFSVVGTIILECLELRKPVIILKSDTYFTQLKGVNLVSSIKEIDTVFLSNLKVSTLADWKSITENEFKNSVPGLIYDPIRSPGLLNDKANNMRLSDYILELCGHLKKI